jgi:hypothetical protein
MWHECGEEECMYVTGGKAGRKETAMKTNTYYTYVGGQY